MATNQELQDCLEQIVNSVETEGCDGCCTVSLESINRARLVLGWVPMLENPMANEKE